jgi:hypothetical protein
MQNPAKSSQKILENSKMWQKRQFFGCFLKIFPPIADNENERTIIVIDGK